MPETSATFPNPPAATIALRSHSMRELSTTNSGEVKQLSPQRIVATADARQATIALMAIDDGNGNDLFIDDTLDGLLARLGISSQELAERSGVAYSHVRNLAQGQKPLTMKIAIKLARGAGMTLAQFLGQAPDRPTTVGVLALQGELMSETHPATASGHYSVVDPFPGLADAGAIIQVVSHSEWVTGRHLAVRYADGRVRIRQAVEQDGRRYLRDGLGDLIQMDGARHEVIGRVTRVIRDLEDS